MQLSASFAGSGEPSPSPWECTSSGVDWVTATAPCGPAAGSLWTIGDLAQQAEIEQGRDRKKWGTQGYRGWKAGGIALGARTDGVIVQASSDAARAVGVAILRKAVGVPRLDLQVTALNPGDPVAYSTLAYEGQRTARRGRGRPLAASLTVNSEGGSTAYFGSRISERFGRVYDKGAESGTMEPGRLWRWELELKGATARNAAGRLLNAGDVRMFVAGGVFEYFSSIGIPPPFVATDVWQPSSGREASDDDRRLLYLSSSVGPMVRRLIAAGRRAEVLAALGITPETPAVPTEGRNPPGGV